MLKYIEDAARLGIKTLVFSGGEAFLLGRDLDEAIWYATKLGMATRVVTNGFWAYREDVAKKRLQELQLCGLVEINFSTGDFHQRFVPVERIVNGALAALSLGMRTVVMIEIHKGRAFSKENLLSDPRLSQVVKDPRYQRLLSILESPWMPVNPTSVIEQEKELLVNRQNVHARKGCESVLTTFVVDPSERLGACCGLTREQIPEMDLGSLKDNSMREMMEEAFSDFLKVWIYVDGPEKILGWAASIDPSIEWENKYAHICHACKELYQSSAVRKVIREHYEEKILDVYFRFWLLTAYQPKSSDAFLGVPKDEKKFAYG